VSRPRAVPCGVTGRTGITNAALCWKVCSLRSNGKTRARASEDVLRGVGQGRAAVSTIALRATVDHGLCGNAPYRSKIKTSLLAQIRVTLCNIKLAARERQRAAWQRGTPRDPAATVL